MLRSVWNEPPPPSPPARGRRDWALVGVLVPLALLEGAVRPDMPWRAVSVIVTVGLVPTLLWRRLLGMIERADLLGGTCEAGPGPVRGWTVTAVLPRAGAAT
ncbi:hypothetical protein [Nonomuraea diastatica]|uniref:hypothetical protein n=1 Tax=Nonomuraea diastatica TaxID=1848329 RepID=UPI001FEA3A54|nr:hypothetical protein [Nonomuraea diastatica]